MLFDYSSNLFQIAFTHNRTGRIIRKRQYNKLGFICYRIFNFFRHKLKVVLIFSNNRNRYAAANFNNWFVANKTWFNNQYFISRAYKRANSHIYSLRTAYGNRNFCFRIVLHIKFALIIIGNFIS